MLIGEPVPDFTVPATHGHSAGLSLHDYIEGKWAVLFSHPADFTPVCTTELAAAQRLYGKLGGKVKFMALSSDSLESHERWLEDIRVFGGASVDFPIIADTDLVVSRLYGMLPCCTTTTTGPLQTVRTVFIIAPDKTLAASLQYPMTVGRGFEEVERLLRALMRVWEDGRVATPADWREGDRVIRRPGVAENDGDSATCLSYVNYTD
jgi:alkyl hydroperoxide reductase subunit AhpC